jgi:3'(2'), 5'-bisphosphate nucleotidase
VSEPSLRELLDVAVEAARAGGTRTLRYFNAGTAVEWKQDGSPLTQADRESERAIGT